MSNNNPPYTIAHDQYAIDSEVIAARREKLRKERHRPVDGYGNEYRAYCEACTPK